MFQFWAADESDSGRSVSFDQTIRVLNADDSVTERQMNINGGFYDCITTEIYDDDSDASIQLGDGDGDNSLTFLDAVQDEIDASPYFQSNR